MNTIEIELRYEILQPEQVSPFLASFQFLHRKHDVDVYFDNEQGQLYQKGIFIRIRNGKKLDFKFNRATLENPDLAIQDYCEEHSFALPLQESDLEKVNALLISLQLQPVSHASLDSIKSANNFIEYYTVDKVRSSYTHKDFTICVDEVADLGTFLEIELMAKNIEMLAAVKIEMELLLAGLQLRPLRTGGYGTLLLRKNNFKQYLNGRFILEEDKIYRTQL
ncbi:MAG TPA: CYTH domain-containing protein [Candidatus Babeliales bacterium]|nr:CYTH domain-containing protein [Candidatus Babeliales bacterium]